MNNNEEEVDLGLALGSTYYSAQSKLRTTSGAGVNADSRVDMAFASSDPLSELVWSPHNGLSLKCAGSSLSNKKQLLWNVGLSLKDSRDERVADEDRLTISRAMLEADNKLGDTTSMLKCSGGSSNCELHTSHGQCDAGCKPKLEVEGEIAGAIEEDKCEEYRKKGRLNSHDGIIADIAECSKRNAEQDILAHEDEVNMEIKRELSSKIPPRTGCNPRSRFEFGAGSNGIVCSDIPLYSEPKAENFCEAPISSHPKLVSRPETDDEETSSCRDIDMDRTKKSIAIPAPNLEEIESSAENDLGNSAAKEDHDSMESRLQKENTCPVEKYPTDNRLSLYKEKGKAKALSDGDMYRSDDEDDSNDSMESCNSAGLFSKGIKRQSHYQEQLVGSKRLKRQIQACQGSNPLVRRDSSFMNWISNIVKGLSDSNKEGSPSLPLTLAHSNDVCGNNIVEDIMCNKPQDCENPKLGFQSMFQSLYSRNTKMPIPRIQKDNCSIDESREITLQVCHKDIDNPCKQIVLHNKEANPQVSRNAHGELCSNNVSCAPTASDMSLRENKASFFPAFSRTKVETTEFDSSCKQAISSAEVDAILDTPLPIRCMPSKSSPLSSLWITRLYRKAANLEDCNQATEEAPVISSEFPMSSDPKPFPQTPRTSEAMASMFAKRLDAFRHIVPASKNIKSSTCKEICFFCGRSSHDLRTCPELTETELDDLLVKISEFDRVEESPSFCIKCFQFDHWASSCPSVPGPSQQKTRARCASFRVQLHSLDAHDHQKIHTQCTPANVESSRKRVSISNEFQRSTASNSADDLKSIQRFPLFNFISVQNTVLEGEMFHAITKLRLSRSDVLRWMNSNVSSDLNGFFLRLRLGSFETGLAGTGYYAARITGDKMKSISCSSTSGKSILVDVGGIQTTVGSQYVSNQDFLEDEIKAWWSRMVKTGGTVPSMDELNSKFKERKGLGF